MAPPTPPRERHYGILWLPRLADCAGMGAGRLRLEVDPASRQRMSSTPSSGADPPATRGFPPVTVRTTQCDTTTRATTRQPSKPA